MSLNSTPALELRGVRKTYGEFQAVKPLDLVVPRGSTFALLGPNGAGKTTTIRMILRIVETDAGEVKILGEPQSQAGLDRIGYLPEERGLYKRMKVRRLLTFFAELKGIPPRESKARIQTWLERLEISDRAESKVQELSKGMQQKIQFIASILHDPEIVILDEPFSGLDPLNQRVLREIVSELKRAGKTILFSTHIIEHAERLCDHVCILARGNKVTDGSIAEVKQRHGGEYIALTLADRSPDALEQVRRLPFVANLREQGNTAEVGLREGVDPQQLLEMLMQANIRLRRFEVTEPSLEQIFIERVNAANEAAGDEGYDHV
ncbi:MAG: ATP-binding cassette domain-containing protein [Longimicrobiales bacterium]